MSQPCGAVTGAFDDGLRAVTGRASGRRLGRPTGSMCSTRSFTFRRREPNVRRTHRKRNKARSLRPLTEAIADTDQEKFRLFMIQEEIASDRGNHEWAAVMRDEQRRLLGSEHPLAPQLGPGLDLDQMVATLTDIGDTVATLRAGIAQDAGTSASSEYGSSLAAVECQVAHLRAECARVAAMSAVAAAQAAAETEV